MAVARLRAKKTRHEGRVELAYARREVTGAGKRQRQANSSTLETRSADPLCKLLRDTHRGEPLMQSHKDGQRRPCNSRDCVMRCVRRVNKARR